MFERFTSEGRRAIVLAQEEARRLQHNYIGTEHLLLGLLAEPDGIPARAAARFGLSLSVGRNDVTEMIGVGQQPVRGGHIPFTPRAKKCLELSLREALQLGHDYIGPEHVLLGIIRESEGVAAQILVRHSGSPQAIRAAVTELMPPAEAGQTRRWLRRKFAGSTVGESVTLQPERQRELRTTPAADASLAEAARIAGRNPVGSHHILLASLADANGAAARALTGLGVDLGVLREALLTADVTGSSDELPEEAGRRQMVVRVAGDRVAVEVSDPVLVKLGQAALRALAAPGTGTTGQSSAGGEAGITGVISGDSPLSASLGLVWQSLHDSLEDIRGRAAASGVTPPAQPGQSAAADA